jgi:hypothetical protein
MAKKPFYAVFLVNPSGKAFLAEDATGRPLVFHTKEAAHRRAVWMEDRREITVFGQYRAMPVEMFTHEGGA